MLTVQIDKVQMWAGDDGDTCIAKAVLAIYSQWLIALDGYGWLWPDVAIHLGNSGGSFQRLTTLDFGHGLPGY